MLLSLLPTPVIHAARARVQAIKSSVVVPSNAAHSPVGLTSAGLLSQPDNVLVACG